MPLSGIFINIIPAYFYWSTGFTSPIGVLMCFVASKKGSIRANPFLISERIPILHPLR